MHCARCGGEGSPPRVRGKAEKPSSSYTPIRITPACAGKRNRSSALLRSSWDHPRVCGEKLPAAVDGTLRVGSPPRVRGKVNQTDVSVLHRGITPACAGKSPEPSAPVSTAEDHPRVCGEKERGYRGRTTVRGSPPRVRGKVTAAVEMARGVGITPACAGKRLQPSRGQFRPADHPRVCGEKKLFCGKCGALMGSPPRVRGKD